MPIVDFRGRPPTPPYLSYFNPERALWIGARVGAREASPAYLQGSLELFFAEMEDAGITTTVALGRNTPEVRMGGRVFPAGIVPNEHVADLQRRYPGRVVGYAGVDVSGTLHDPIAETARAIQELGLRGVFVEPGRTGGVPSDRRCYPIYETCAALGVPVVVMSGPFAGPSLEATHPSHVDQVANDFPRLPLVCGHGCWPFVQEIIGVAFKHANVYVSPDIYMFVPGAADYVHAANTFMQDQFLFGTAYPIRPLKQTVDDFLALPFDRQVLPKLLYDNAARLLELPA